MAETIRIEFDAAEMYLLARMAENELFRMPYIDPRFPKYSYDPDAFRAAQTITGRLSERLKLAKGLPTAEELAEKRVAQKT